eukprot:tig00020961_g16742.t1
MQGAGAFAGPVLPRGARHLHHAATIEIACPAAGSARGHARPPPVPGCGGQAEIAARISEPQSASRLRTRAPQRDGREFFASSRGLRAASRAATGASHTGVSVAAATSEPFQPRGPIEDDDLPPARAPQIDLDELTRELYDTRLNYDDAYRGNETNFLRDAMRGEAGGEQQEQAGRDLLDRIVLRKWEAAKALEEAAFAAPHHPLRMRLEYLSLRESKRLGHALTRNRLCLIGDIRRRMAKSPRNAAAWAKLYRRAGVDAVAVQTDAGAGALEDIERVVYSDPELEHVPNPAMLPVIAHDYFVHPIQIAEAAEMGAAGVLLIVSLVGRDLEELLDATTTMGLEPVVEVCNVEELDLAFEAGAGIISVTALDRNDPTAPADLAVPEQMRALIPDGVVTIAHGGIERAEDAQRMREAGFDAVWVGDALASAENPARFVRDATDRNFFGRYFDRRPVPALGEPAPEREGAADEEA